MRIQILSDLHFEFDPDHGEAFAKAVPVVGDVLVLAGDVISLRNVSVARRTLGWFCDRFKDVVYVPGNHEYYGSHPEDVDTCLTVCDRDISNLHVLNPEGALIGETRFVGGTLWFPNTPDEGLYRGMLNDFRLIKDFVPWVHDTHAGQIAFLKANVWRGDVVVTHHLPHPRSIAAQYAGSALNRFFLANDAAGLVERGEARLWIHGHTHVTMDYTIGETRVVCNPRGYPGEGVRGFDPACVVEI